MTAEPIFRETEVAGYKVRVYPATEQDRGFVEFSIPSSDPKADPYAVIVDSSRITCVCKSYEFRQHCRHVNLVKSLLENR